MLVRLVGTNEAKGREVIDSIPDAEIESFVSADEAAHRAADLAREEP
jgi:succinyl-CoA synthetase beta subunit